MSSPFPINAVNQFLEDRFVTMATSSHPDVKRYRRLQSPEPNVREDYWKFAVIMDRSFQISVSPLAHRRPGFVEVEIGVRKSPLLLEGLQTRVKEMFEAERLTVPVVGGDPVVVKFLKGAEPSPGGNTEEHHIEKVSLEFHYDTIN